MSQPRQLRRPDQTPAEIVVPRLSEAETRVRAGRAFDAAATAVVRSIARPPPVAEVTALRRMVDDATRSSAPGEIVDFPAILDQYTAANPNSTIARYSRLTGGSTDWLLTNGRVGFNSRQLTTILQTQLTSARSATIQSLVDLNTPSNRNTTTAVGTLDSELASGLQAQLSAQLRSGRNQLPATIEFRAQQQQFYFASLLPPPEQRVNFERGG